MSFRSVLFSFLTIAALAGTAAAQLPCATPGADPCVLSSTANIPVGTYDIRPKSLVVTNKQLTITGVGEMKILANNITFQPGGRFVTTGTDGATRITLAASGAIDIQSQGTSKSKIDVSGNDGGGIIDLHSVGNLTVNGTLIANATNLFGFGGSITLTSDTGNISITGDPSEGLKSFGNAQGSGGSIALTSTLGSISINTQIVPKGGDCGSCFIDLFAGQSITSTAQGVLDMRASGFGDGGELSVIAGTDINLAGNIFANGSSDDFDGGDGGSVDLDAGGNIVVGGRIELNGAGRYDTGIAGFSVDGGGGTGDFAADGDITLNGPMFAISKGYGSSDDFDFDAGGNVNFNAEIDLTGDVFGANLTLIAEKLVTITARLRTQTLVDPAIDMSVLGGGFDLDACQINITATGEVIATGPGGNPSGSNVLTASTGLTVGGKLTATDVNELWWRTSQPVITGMVSPPPTLIQNPALACCDVQCPVPTTSTTSSTSTSLAPTTSSTSSTTVIPTTTSSTSSTIVLPTTTSTTSATPTTVVPTTSSTTHAPTTSTPPTTQLPTTTTSSTTLQSTTSTSSPTPTTTSTSLATTTSTSLGATTSTSIAATTTTTGGTTSTTSSTATPTTSAPTTTSAPATTSTVATTSSTSSTGIPNTTSSSTLVPTTSTIVVPTSSTTTVVLPTTTSTTVQTTCFDTAVGIPAVQCRLDAMNQLVLGASQEDLGGRKIARQVTKALDKATTLVQEGASSRKLKNAQKKLRTLVTKLNNALAKGNADGPLVNELSELGTEAQNELTALTTK